MTRRIWPAGLCFALLVLSHASWLTAEDRVLPDPSSHRRTSIVEAVERTKYATVNIHSEKRARTAEVLFSAGRDKKINGMGTGIIVDERGYIVTNYHVVRDVESLRVTLVNGDGYDARVVSYDSREDLAVIKIDPKDPLPVMAFGTSSDLMLAEDVLAIGNAFGYEHTVTRGIISQLGRNVDVDEEQSYRNLIQIDAAINPGNSGGPLLNSDGEVIGINVAIRAGAQRIGFAIPIDDARLVIAKLLNIERLNNHFHGLDVMDHKRGADRKLIVRNTQSGSPAAVAGIKPGDVIKKAGNVEIIDAADLERALLGRSTGSDVDLVVERDGETQTVSLEIAELGTEQRVPARRTLPDAPPPAVAASSSSTNSADKSWSILGVHLTPIAEKDVSLSGQPYRGGMQITEVRAESPAARNGLRAGDILVGLHVWETINGENIRYVLDHPHLETFNPLKFYILRDKETLYGHLEVAR